MDRDRLWWLLFLAGVGALSAGVGAVSYAGFRENRMRVEALSAGLYANMVGGDAAEVSGPAWWPVPVLWGAAAVLGVLALVVGVLLYLRPGQTSSTSTT